MTKPTKPIRILNAFESFKAGAPLSDEMSKVIKKIESRNPGGRVDLRPREFKVYARAVAASELTRNASFVTSSSAHSSLHS